MSAQRASSQVWRFALATLLAGLCSFVGSGKTLMMTQVHGGTHSFQFEANELWLEYCGWNGSVRFHSHASIYDDQFYLGANGQFYGTQEQDMLTLDRHMEFDGGGDVEAITVSHLLKTDLSLSAAVAVVDQNQAFDPSGASPGIGFGGTLSGEYVFFRTIYDEAETQAEALTRRYGISPDEAIRLQEGGIFGLIAELGGHGFEASDVVYQALEKGIDAVRELLLRMRSAGSPPLVERAAARFDVPVNVVLELYRRFGHVPFAEALATSADFKSFHAKLLGWLVFVHSETLLSSTNAEAGDVITAAFRLVHPATGEYLSDPTLVPYLQIAGAGENGHPIGLDGNYSFIPFSLDQESATYYAFIETQPETGAPLKPGSYVAYLVLRSPGNDLRSTLQVEFTVG